MAESRGRIRYPSSLPIPNDTLKLPVPLNKIMKARVLDVPLEPDDILSLPNSSMKEILKSGALAASLETTPVPHFLGAHSHNPGFEHLTLL